MMSIGMGKTMVEDTRVTRADVEATNLGTQRESIERALALTRDRARDLVILARADIEPRERRPWALANAELLHTFERRAMVVDPHESFAAHPKIRSLFTHDTFHYSSLGHAIVGRELARRLVKDAPSLATLCARGSTGGG